MSILVDKNVVRLNVTGSRGAELDYPNRPEEEWNIPMDETKLVDGLYCQHTLCDVEARNVLGEGVVLDEHHHQISSTARQPT